MSDQYVYNQHENHERIVNKNDAKVPFKRTAEKILTWVGIVLHAIWFVLIIGAIAIFKNPEFQQQIEMTGQDASQLNNINPTSLITFLIPLVIALVAVFLFKKPILAGILLIIAAATGVFLSASLISGILWLIAGIMLLVRKPKKGNYIYQNPEHRSQQYQENPQDVEAQRHQGRQNVVHEPQDREVDQNQTQHAENNGDQYQNNRDESLKRLDDLDRDDK
ncbi:DUF4064 domain-containing protein [Staphylococcus coagulans]|uniref:DUF4064 domain-containing protein n=1 Tax=Staphylococcus coagulans TaxID=74706 RepID=UPI001BECDF37|nr:DUF4064 domain-containing protein [Staphylococcus coagulans]MBT2813581.1 DUF4064 domain-containing protein [Staphylococcus coagulans]MBT2815844.1 DUF4064 domain-containing protein [Staphylococcus coagulans]MBT2836767.1 DUF4064 domain-containing protein [Staphylococcus coagulans]MBT2841295.1 DUF4064 domain-containing protein [Staphylococcus coagulans]MBT2847806.1 DUF4064 domain-containing protein [Staphylococcus coagulans]